MLLATVEPRQAEALAHEVLRRARGDDLAEAASVAERALALSSRELLRVDDAHRHLRRAISIAEGAELPVRAAEARLSLALEHIHSGHPRAAWHELSRAESGLAANHPRLHNQVAIVLGRLGHYDDALHAAGRAVAGADDSGNTAERAMTHGNRGLVHAYRGSFADAERDLATARELFVSIEDDLGAFDMLHNLGWLAARQGDLPAALERMDVAEQGIAGLGVPLAVYQLDRVEVLLAAGLHDEATATSTSAAAELLEAGMLAELPDVLLLQSRAALASGDVTGALTAAERAQTYLLEQERPGLAVLAEAAALRALVAGDSVDVRRATVCAEKLTRAGRLEEALELKVVAGEAALRAAEPQGLALLEAVATQSRSRVARHRAFAAQAAVALHRWHGRPSEALVAAQAGLRALEDVRATFGATELRVSTAGAARAITGGAVELALEQGRPATVLRWSEVARATALLRPPVRPPDDATFARDLDLLRAVTREREEAVLRGETTTTLDRRRSAIEQTVRRHARHAVAAQTTLPAPPTLSSLRRRLRGRALVDFIQVADRLHALVVTGRRAVCTDLGPVTAVETELRHLRFALRRATSSDETALASVATSGRRLEDLIVRPLRLGPDDGLVIVPTGLLHAMPWRLLPSLTERTIEVSPSATLWSRELGAPPTGPAVVVAGPGLPGALGEIADVAARRTGATVLVGDAATSGDVLSALDGAASAHLACHGRFRSDNPQFSSLLLADGPVVVYDLERLRQAPAHVVLSACDSARTAVRPGEEVLGLASALLASGTRSLVASVVPVADDATRRLMADLHDCWDGVSAPVDALAAAAVRASARGGADAIAAAAFNCFTAGAQPLA